MGRGRRDAALPLVVPARAETEVEEMLARFERAFELSYPEKAHPVISRFSLTKLTRLALPDGRAEALRRFVVFSSTHTQATTYEDPEPIFDRIWRCLLGTSGIKAIWDLGLREPAQVRMRTRVTLDPRVGASRPTSRQLVQLVEKLTPRFPGYRFGWDRDRVNFRGESERTPLWLITSSGYECMRSEDEAAVRMIRMLVEPRGLAAVYSTVRGQELSVAIAIELELLEGTLTRTLRYPS